MKYGERLYSYSVPEWRTHNILYAEIKYEIKELTVTTSSFSRSGYERLQSSFFEELQSTNLFVSCKEGEIAYRFRQCHAALSSKTFSEDDWQLSKEVHKLNQEIYNLSRFIGAQFTGFKKLIKKYRRHAPPEELAEGRDLRKFDEALHDRDSFASVDLTPQFLDLSELYVQLRRLRDAASNVSGGLSSNGSLSGTGTTNGTTSTSSRNAMPTSKQLIGFDAEMFTSHTDVHQFWVHNDNLVQLKVMLLQYMELICSAELGGYTHSTYLDTKDLQFAHELRDPAQLRTAETGRDYVLAAMLLIPASGMRFMASEPSEGKVKQLMDGTLDHADEESDPALRWVAARGCKPVVGLRMQCSRFKATEGSAWASIDSNISIDGDSPTSRFPYHVLALRVRPEDSVPWLATLRESHLLYPVRNDFSLYAWSILQTRPQQVLERPHWLDLLDNSTDIRRQPKTETTLLAKPSLRASRSSLSLSPRSIGCDTSPEQNGRQEGKGGQREFRYWNEFDEPEDGGDQFFNEIDEDLRRARMAAKFAQPVYQLGATMRKQFHNWFEHRGSVGSTISFDTASVSSEGTSSGSQDEHTPLRGSANRRFSPRIGDHSRDMEANYGRVSWHGSAPQVESCEADLALDPATLIRRRNDQGLALITFLCFCLAMAIVALVFVILMTEDLQLLPAVLHVALSLFLLMSLGLAVLGYVANSFRSSPGWLSQAIVHTVLLCVVCLAVGAIANIAVPEI